MGRGLHLKSRNLAHEFVRAKGLGQKVGPVVGGRDLHAFHRLVENGLAHEQIVLGDVSGPGRLPGVACRIDASLVVAVQLDRNIEI